MATDKELDEFLAKAARDDLVLKKDVADRTTGPDFQLATLVRNAVAEAHRDFSAAQIAERANKILATGAYALSHDSRIRPADDLRNIEKALRIDGLVVARIADTYAATFTNEADATRARLRARGIAALGLFDSDPDDDDDFLGAA